MMKRALLMGLLAGVTLTGCELIDNLKPGPGPGPGPTPDPGRPCTLIGCIDQVSITVKPKAGNTFRDGGHEVWIDVDGVRTSCTFPFPPLGGTGGHYTGVCTGGAGEPWQRPNLNIAPVVTCTMGSDGNTAWQKCEPVPGQFEEHINIPGTPKSIKLTERVAGDIILERTLTPAYKESSPNGPMCGPVCKQDSITVEF